MFGKNKKILAIPTESSICTGETIIGFYDETTRKLCFAELVKNKEDIAAFYEKYGLSVGER